MKIRGRLALKALVVVFILCVCAPAGAKWFNKGQPVPDWGMQAYKTRTPDYARDSSAVVLYDEYVETVDGEGRAVERERYAVRILKPQGRNQGACMVSYDVDEKIDSFRAWTIAADEKTYQAQDTDFTDVGNTQIPIMLSTRKVRIAHPPAMDVGATIVCESEELMEPYIQEKDWNIQMGIPVVFEALEIDLPPGRALTSSWHRHNLVAPTQPSPNVWRWELRDTPALDVRDVHLAPVRPALEARMTVQWGAAAVAGRDKQWQAIGEWVTQLEAGRPDPSPEITASVNTLIAGASDFYTRLTRITQSIQKNIRYFIVMRGIGGLQANHAADIFRNRYGDCKDKTTLLISMLQVAGIHAVYVPVDDRRDVVDPNSPSLIGNHMITAVEVPASVNDPRLQAVVKGNDGKRWLIFDPTNEYTPVGNLPSYEQGSYGILAAGAESQIIQLPVLPPADNGTVQSGTFTLAADGTLAGAVDASHSGPDAADVRWILKYTDEKERREYWETAIAHDVPGVTLKSFQFVQAPAIDKPLEFKYQFTASQYAHTAGGLLLVRPRVVGSFAMPFDSTPRTLPIDLGATGDWKDSYDITLPPGYVVDDTPDPVDVDAGFASYHSKVSGHGNELHYEREYVVRQVEIPPDKAAEFRKLEGAILMDERGTAVLKKAGN